MEYNSHKRVYAFLKDNNSGIIVNDSNTKPNPKPKGYREGYPDTMIYTIKNPDRQLPKIMNKEDEEEEKEFMEYVKSQIKYWETVKGDIWMKKEGYRITRNEIINYLSDEKRKLTGIEAEEYKKMMANGWKENLDPTL